MDVYISLASSRMNSFKKWSVDRSPSNDDDDPGGATPIALPKPHSDRDAPADLPHRPWVIPGVGGAF